MSLLTLDLSPILHLTHEQFTRIALANPDLRLELTADGALEIMPPTGGNTGRRNSKLTYQVEAWNQIDQLGEVFDSSTVFRLPNGAERSPDVAWVERTRWDVLTPEEQDTFPPLCPDFVIELRPKTDTLSKLQAKMQEYLANGCRLGWLIDIQNQTLEIYRPKQAPQILNSPAKVSDEAILPGFVLNLQAIWTV
ncbi:MAG: Uma2 family endonuclease [Cyanobacteria bacterium J06638_22]